MTGRATRACDQCRFRKVRCNGVQPCSQCEHLNLPCDFSAAPAKRKPAVRGRLVAQLRDKAKTASSPLAPAPLPALTSIAGLVDAAGAGAAPESTYSAGDRSASVTSTCSTDYTRDFFLDLVQDFEAIVYPVNPIVTPAEIVGAIDNMHQSHEDAALVYAFAAVTVNLTQTSWTLHGDIATQITDLVRHSLASHRQADITDVSGEGSLGELSITIKRALTCVFIEICQMAFKRYNRSFVILREAISMIQSLNLHLYSGETPVEKAEICRLQRLYWETFIHERFLTIMSGHPCTVPPLTTGIPYADATIPPHVDLGFSRLVHLFLIMDEPFLSHWRAQQDNRHPGAPMTAQWIETKQAQLDRDEMEAAEAERNLSASGQGNLTELQLADLFVTRLWLRTLVWQLALSQGLLRSAPPQSTHQGLSLHFPAQRLSIQLRSLVSRLGSVASIGTHGSGILQKLFEITSTIADVLALPQGPGQSQEEAKARMEDFIFLVKFLFSFERIQKEQRDYLREKLEVLQSMYTVVNFDELAGSPT